MPAATMRKWVYKVASLILPVRGSNIFRAKKLNFSFFYLFGHAQQALKI